MQQISSKPFLAPFLISVILTFFSGCAEDNRENVILTVSDEDAVQLNETLLDEISPIITDGLELSLWASEELVGDIVAINYDNPDRLFVTITERRRNAELDIRRHRNWEIESIMFETVEDRRKFVLNELDPERSEENTWLTDHNEDGIHDWRDLTVNKESVFTFEDLTGNGFANQAELFIRNFHDEITDVAGTVLYHDGDVFMGVSPDLWRIRDTNGDGYGDQKVSISHGYGTNIGFAGHGMSGLKIGPDGRIYWSIGDVGMSVTDQDGKRWHYPRQGVIVRSEPDGSNFEVYAAGFRNTHEFDFDKYGNLITVDNDGDHAGEYERLIYVINGGDSGWRLNWQFGKYNDPKNNEYKVLMDEQYYSTRFEDQAAHLLPPLARYHSGPAGMVYNPGTALSEKWKDHFFVAEFVGSPTQSGINAFTLKENGASFELDNDESVLQGVLATGLSFGPDGALYIADWIEGWELKQAGRIWKLDTSNESSASLRTLTKNLLSEDFSEYSSDVLFGLLKHEDMRVRRKTQFELATRGAQEILLESVHQTENQLARIHGIWGVAQIARDNIGSIESLLEFLDDNDPEIRAQTAKVLGDVKYEPAGQELISLLTDENPRVQFMATEALGRISYRPAFDSIITMLEENNDEDVYLRHGGAIALERIRNINALLELADHPSRAVRIAAVVALNRLENPGVARFLQDEDEFIVTNAARAINDDTLLEEAVADLAKMLEQDQFMNEPLIRRAINANLYNATPAEAQRLAEFSVRNDVPEVLREEALKTLAVWPEPSLLDRVTGDPRGAIENDPDIARQAIVPVIAQLFDDESPVIKNAALETVSSLNLDSAIPGILSLIQNDANTYVRAAALRALVDLEYEDIEEAAFIALEDDSESVRMNALRTISELKLPGENIVTLIEPVLENGTVEERQVALQTLGQINHPYAFAVLEKQMDELISGNIPNEIQLDLLLAAEAAPSESIQEKIRHYQSEKPDNLVSDYSEALYGGNANEGRRIFYQNTAAQCIRCHVVDGAGSEIGPDLTTVGDRLSREEMLEAMVNPNARIAPGFGSVTITLNDGEIIRGLLSEETDSQITVTRTDQQWVIDKSDITERINSPSGMPAMGDLISRSNLRDLVEYMSTLTYDD